MNKRSRMPAKHVPDPASPRAWLQAGEELLRELRDAGYEFVSVTPETHRRVIKRDPRKAAIDLPDVFGWSRSFSRDVLSDAIFSALSRLDAVEAKGKLLKSRVRASSLGRHLLLHSAYPTDSPDSVFFGPDTYRFVRFIQAVGVSRGVAVDIGTGSGAGGLAILPKVDHVILTDTNPYALRLARINLAAAGAGPDDVSFVRASGLGGVRDRLDWVIANPPFLVDESKRGYRHGGGSLGAGVSIRWARAALGKLRKGGKLAMYTASAIQAGEDLLKGALARLVKDHGSRLEYAELDPDIFGEELDQPAYSKVDRIAAVGILIRKG